MKTHLVFISALLMACSNPKMHAEIELISQMQNQYDSLLIVANAIDIQSAGKNLKKYKEVITYAQEKIDGSSKPSMKTMNFLNDLKLTRRPFKNAATTKKSLSSSIIENKKQLQNLNNDLKRSVFSKQELSNILEQEKSLLQESIQKVKDFEETYRQSEWRFDSLYQLSKTYQFNRQ